MSHDTFDWWMGLPTGDEAEATWVRPRDEHGRAFFAPNEVPPADEHFAHWQGRLTHPDAFCNGGDARKAHEASAPLSLRCIGGWIPSGNWWLHCPVCRAATPATGDVG